MQPPIRPFLPGDELNANDLNRMAEQGWRGSQISAGGVSEAFRIAGTAGSAGMAPGVRFFVRITGGGSGCAALPLSGESGSIYPYQPAPPADNCYCGIQQISDRDGTIYDAVAGLEFDSFAFPLVEMTGRGDVPVDAIVWACMSADETHAEFIWEGAEQFNSGESGSECGSGSYESTNCVTFTATQCIDGEEVTTTTTIEFPFPVRVRTA